MDWSTVVTRLKPAVSPVVIAVAASVALLLLIADQATKGFIVNNYAPNEPIVGSTYLSLVFVINTGGICGYAQGAGGMLTIVGVATTAFIIISILFFMPDTFPYAAAFGMLLAGAVGNLIDRLRFGYVVDFITLDFLHWPSFNIADASIVGGIALVGLLTMLEMVQEGAQEAGAQPQRLGRGTIVFLVVAGLVFAVAYLFCVIRPFG